MEIVSVESYLWNNGPETSLYRGHLIITLSQNDENLDPPPSSHLSDFGNPALARTFTNFHQPIPPPYKNSKSCHFIVS